MSYLPFIVFVLSMFSPGCRYFRVPLFQGVFNSDLTLFITFYY